MDRRISSYLPEATIVAILLLVAVRLGWEPISTSWPDPGNFLEHSKYIAAADSPGEWVRRLLSTRDPALRYVPTSVTLLLLPDDPGIQGRVLKTLVVVCIVVLGPLVSYALVREVEGRRDGLLALSLHGLLVSGLLPVRLGHATWHINNRWQDALAFPLALLAVIPAFRAIDPERNQRERLAWAAGTGILVAAVGHSQPHAMIVSTVILSALMLRFGAVREWLATGAAGAVAFVPLFAIQAAAGYGPMHGDGLLLDWVLEPSWRLSWLLVDLQMKSILFSLLVCAGVLAALLAAPSALDTRLQSLAVIVALAFVIGWGGRFLYFRHALRDWTPVLTALLAVWVWRGFLDGKNLKTAFHRSIRSQD